MPANSSFETAVSASAVRSTLAASLRAALADAARAITAQNAAPLRQHWTARTPAAIHPARHDVDLLFREVFGGMRMPVEVHFGDHDGVSVQIASAPRTPATAGPIWRNFTAAELATAYSPRATVSDMDGIFDAWRERGAHFRAANLTAELRYGESHDEVLDLYVPRSKSQNFPLWIFIHGGYWQAVDKEHNAHFAAGMLDAGYAVAMLNYTLAPAASLAVILKQMQSATGFLANQSSALGCDPRQIHIAGHSAGGHLAAMLASLPEGALIRSALPLSGIFDIEPLARLPMGRTLAITEADTIASLSPQNLRPLPHIRIGLAVGGRESAEFHRQSRDYAAHTGAECRIVPDRNHFDLLDGLIGGELLDFALGIAARA